MVGWLEKAMCNQSTVQQQPVFACQGIGVAVWPGSKTKPASKSQFHHNSVSGISYWDYLIAL
jgi:hypothetical protein